jgi:hypothetical protein
MWKTEKPNTPGFYWHRDLSGDIQIVMRDREGLLWCSKLDAMSEVFLVEENGAYWPTPIWPLPMNVGGFWLHDILIRKRWIQ